jgi:hypothetical protein
VTDPKSTVPHLIWATVALVVLLVGTMAALRGLEVVSNPLAPRLETVLHTNLAVLAGSPEAFLVAHNQGGHLDATSDQTLTTVLGISLGTTRARIEWDFAVDLGIDLRDIKPGAFAVTCTADELACTWYVPDPTNRPPAILTETLVVTVDGAALLSSAVEDKNAKELVSRVTELTEENVQSAAFWSTATENVRSSLEGFASTHLQDAAAESSAAPPTIRVVFANERPPEPSKPGTGP